MLSKTDRSFIQATIESLQSFLAEPATIAKKGVPQPQKQPADDELLKFQQNTKALIVELKKHYGLQPIKLKDPVYQDLAWKHKVKHLQTSIKIMAERGLATYTEKQVGPLRKVMETFTFTKL